MSNTNKFPKPKTITVTGEVMWMQVDKPDPKFGKYNAKVRIPEAAYKALLADTTKIAESHRAELAKEKPKIGKYQIAVPVGPEEDKDGNEVAGGFVFRASAKSSYKKRDGTIANLQPPVVVDAKKNKVNGAQIGRGSKVKLLVDLRPYAMDTGKVGVTAALQGVQILELVEYSGGGADLSMFKEEDGYVAEDSGGGADFAETTGGGGGDTSGNY